MRGSATHREELDAEDRKDRRREQQHDERVGHPLQPLQPGSVPSALPALARLLVCLFLSLCGDRHVSVIICCR